MNSKTSCEATKEYDNFINYEYLPKNRSVTVKKWSIDLSRLTKHL